MSVTSASESRAKILRDRLYLLRIPVSRVARQVGRSRPWVSLVLNARAESEMVLDAVEKIVNEEEAAHSQAA